jgi:nucleoside-diphosphate-sugar epimerase
LAQKLISAIRPAATIISDEQRVRPEKSEVERLLGSNEKIKSLTGWVPEWSLDNGLEATIEWFKEPANLAAYKSDIYNV